MGRAAAPAGEGLYLGWSTAARFRGGENVFLSWFVAERKTTGPAAKRLVRGYDKAGPLRQRLLDNYVSELFTREEAEQFERRFMERHGASISFMRVKTPIDPRVNPTGLVPATFAINLYTPPRRLCERLDFAVWAYYDMEGGRHVRPLPGSATATPQNSAPTLPIPQTNTIFPKDPSNPEWRSRLQ